MAKVTKQDNKENIAPKVSGKSVKTEAVEKHPKLKKAASIAIKTARVLTTPIFTEAPEELSVAKKIRSKLPMGDPDKHFDLRRREATKSSGVKFSDSTRQDGHKNKVKIEVPRYKISYDSLKKFAAWQEAGREEGYNPESSDKTGAIDGIFNPTGAADKLLKKNKADKDFQFLIDLDQKLKDKMGGSLSVVPQKEGSLKNKVIIEIDVAEKSPEEIKAIMDEILGEFGIKDSKMTYTAANRLYKGQKQGISADDPIGKTSSKQKENSQQNVDEQSLESNENIKSSSSDIQGTANEQVQGTSSKQSKSSQQNPETGQSNESIRSSSSNTQSIANEQVQGTKSGVYKRDDLGYEPGKEQHDNETIKGTKGISKQQYSHQPIKGVTVQDGQQFSLSSGLSSFGTQLSNISVNHLQSERLKNTSVTPPPINMHGRGGEFNNSKQFDSALSGIKNSLNLDIKFSENKGENIDTPSSTPHVARQGQKQSGPALGG